MPRSTGAPITALAVGVLLLAGGFVSGGAPSGPAPAPDASHPAVAQQAGAAARATSFVESTPWTPRGAMSTMALDRP